MVVEAAPNAPPLPAATITLGSAITSERQIWQAALLLVRRHGEDAVRLAEREARKHEQASDDLGYVVWAWIARVTADFVKPAPEFGERVH